MKLFFFSLVIIYSFLIVFLSSPDLYSQTKTGHQFYEDDELIKQMSEAKQLMEVDKSQVQTVGPVQVITSERNDLSLPLSELAKMYTPPATTNNHKVFPLRPFPFQSQVKEMPFVKDPSLQDWQGARSSGTILQNFDGIEVGDNGFNLAPPDPNGDVGPNHYVQMTNIVFEIFNKTGTPLSGPFNINVLWSGFGGPCENYNNGDPVVVYDQLADRWFLSQFAVDDPNNYSICVACSQTSDPTGAYYRYQFNFTNDFPEYQKFGVWNDAYSVTYRLFPNAGGFDMRAGALERNAMLIGNPAQMVNFSISNLIPTVSDGFLPGDLDGPAPPAGTPIPVLGHQDDGLTGVLYDRLAIFELTPDWNNTANSTFTGPVYLATNPYDAIFTAGIQQPSTAQQLDILSHFAMYSLQTRYFGTHMSIVANHTVDVGVNHAGVRWYELRNSGAGWSIFQQGTYAPDGNNRWMGSIAMDGAGNIALGYSVSSFTTFPAVRFTGHTAGAAPGVMDVAEQSIIEGTGSQTSPSRWGDYSMMTVDPTDDATFWYTNEYYATTSSFNWKTRIASLNLGTNSTFALSVIVGGGWNMVSVPGINPAGMGVDTWWSGKDPAADVFKYAGGYVSVATATPSEGYWMKNLGPQVYNYPAIEIVPHNDVPLALGWNLIGLYETTVTLPLTTNPAGIITTPVFEYSGGYVAATDIEPGYGYWAKADVAGVITNLSAPPLSKKGGEVVEFFPDDWGKITLTDASGINYTLYAVEGDVDLNKYELPPLPPAGMFDIRYGSGRIAEDINSSIQEIQMTGVTYPLTVRAEGMDIRVMDESGKTVNVNLKSGEEVVISDATIQKLMVTGELIPAEYVLENNYPNPFNPSTTIEFSLPEDVSNVTLSVYNALGERVAELVNGSLVAGKYQYQWSAKNVATGMYIYELRTDKFVSVKKMVLMK